MLNAYPESDPSDLDPLTRMAMELDIERERNRRLMGRAALLSEQLVKAEKALETLRRANTEAPKPSNN